MFKFTFNVNNLATAFHKTKKALKQPSSQILLKKLACYMCTNNYPYPISTGVHGKNVRQRFWDSHL